jgi:hypothetical protein
MKYRATPRTKHTQSESSHDSDVWTQSANCENNVHYELWKICKKNLNHHMTVVIKIQMTGILDGA